LLIASAVYFLGFQVMGQTCHETLKLLSKPELKMLGQRKPLKNGGMSVYKYPTPNQWVRLRKILVERSVKANPLLDPVYTAYTPGETLMLMKRSHIKAWHKEMAQYKIPNWAKIVVFVPCAKTKPWATAPRGLYKSYNRVRQLRDQGKLPSIYFVSLSEPLGIVPEEYWGDFPQYDNPGLFKEEVMRSGLFTSDWPRIGFDKKLIVPFDELAYQKSIEQLGTVVAQFVSTNKDKTFVSFVNDAGEVTSHEDMLNVAAQRLGSNIDLSSRFLKRPAPRVPPEHYIAEILRQRFLR
jgi:hypothetical protein